MSASDYAIVLRLAEYSETSQIATLFTRGAAIARVIAKGARKSTKTRVSAGLDLLEYGEVSYISARGDAQLGTLTEWVQRDTFHGLRRNLTRLYGGLYTTELVEATAQERDPHPGLFDALLTTLRALGEDVATAPLIADFQRILLQEIGYAPNLVSCVACGKVRAAGAGAYFSAPAGGLICRQCQPRFPETIRLRAALLDSTPSTGDPVAWFDLLHYHAQHIVARELHTAKQLARQLHGAQRAK